MATVHVGSEWNLRDSLVSSAPIKCMPRNFYSGDVMSGQLRDLVIISLRGNMKMHKPIKTTQFFHDHGHSPNLCRSRRNRRSGITGSPPEIKWGQNPFFANKSRQNGDRDAQIVPNDLPRRAASEDVQLHTDLLWSWSDLDLTWGQIF